jgi:hypothetical protein
MTQASEAVGAGLFAYGRELARTELIEPTLANNCTITDLLIAQLQQLKIEDEAHETIGGMLICTVEEASMILLELRAATALIHRLVTDLEAAQRGEGEQEGPPRGSP